MTAIAAWGRYLTDQFFVPLAQTREYHFTRGVPMSNPVLTPEDVVTRGQSYGCTVLRDLKAHGRVRRLKIKVAVDFYSHQSFYVMHVFSPESDSWNELWAVPKGTFDSPSVYARPEVQFGFVSDVVDHLFAKAQEIYA